MRTVTVQPAFHSTPDEQTFHGRIVSLIPSGQGWLMRFDPSWWLSGITANVAAAQAMHLTCVPEKCEAVPNDHFVVDESRRQLVFKLPRTVTGTVLTSGTNVLGGSRIGAARLARLVAAGKQAKLFEGLDSGMWIRVRGDTVITFAQQYVP